MVASPTTTVLFLPHNVYKARPGIVTLTYTAIERVDADTAGHFLGQAKLEGEATELLV